MLLIGSILGLTLYIIFTLSSNSTQRNYIHVGIVILLICILIGIIVWRPIFLVYGSSSILSLFIKTPPYLNKKIYFPRHTYFENPKTFQKIKQEVDNMLQKTNGGNTLPLTQESFGGENIYIGSDVKIVDGVKRAWRVFNIKIGETYTKDVVDHFPVLITTLKKLPEVLACTISVLEAGIRIPMHVGYYKGIMRYMIATHVPSDQKNVYLCNNGIKYHWKEGEGVLWDDNYPHKVYNNTMEKRVVIYMDVVRPLKDESISFLTGLNKWIIDQTTGTSIVKDEIKRTEMKLSIDPVNQV